MLVVLLSMENLYLSLFLVTRLLMSYNAVLVGSLGKGNNKNGFFSLFVLMCSFILRTCSDHLLGMVIVLYLVYLNLKDREQQ